MSNLPPGYRFYPTEEELICFYLRNKLESRREDIDHVIPVVDVCSVDPWELAEMLQQRRCGGDGEPWFFFCPRQEREARGGRPSRTTPSGYWKAAGTPGVVYSAARRPIGMKKTMVFYRGRAPTGAKTKWKMNEYRAFQYFEDAGACSSSTAAHATPPPNPPQLRSEFSLFRLYTKSGGLRQFDRRPCNAGSSAGDQNNPAAAGPSTASAAMPLANDDEKSGSKRKRSGSNDATSSDDDDGGSVGSMQQQQLLPNESHLADAASWIDFYDWP